MINPANVIRVMKQRHQFIVNHPEVIPYIKKVLSESTFEGTEVAVNFKVPNGEECNMNFMIQESDMSFLNQVKEIFEQMR